MDPWGMWKKVIYLYIVTCIPALWYVLKYRKQEIYQTKPDSRAVLSDFVFYLKKEIHTGSWDYLLCSRMLVSICNLFSVTLYF